MDRKENLGLQIAVILFAAVICVLAVTTYIYFDKSHQQGRVLASNQNQLAELQASSEQAQEEIERLRALLTNRPASIEDIESAHANDVARVAPSDAKTTRPTYQRLVGHMVTAVNDAVSREARMRADLLATRAHIDREREVHQSKLDKVSGEVTKVEQILATERAENRVDRQRMTGQLDRMVIILREKAAEISAGKIELENVRESLTDQITQLDRRYHQIRDQWEATHVEQFEHPDGKILVADAGRRIVHIDLGSADLLRRGTSFKVYDESTSDITRARSKGEIEVTKIIGPHQAEARIVSDRLADPLLSDDVIFTPLWQPGKVRRFAIAGRIDIDKDGRDDRKIVTALITSNGGQIDCEVDDRGRRNGDLSIETRYLVLGSRPTTIDREEGDRAAYDSLLAEAKQLGIDFLSVDKLLESHSVKLTRSERNTSGEASGFQRRQRGVRNSAY